MPDHATLNFNPNVDGEVNVDLKRLLAHKFAIAANSGGGKSWLLRSMLEHTHGHVQQLIIDDAGEFRTLREVFLDYIVAGGEDADLRLAPEKSSRVLRELLQSRVNIIVDLSSFDHNERGEIVVGMTSALFTLASRKFRSVLIALDEAHLAAPESGQLRGYGKESLEAVTRIATAGRKYQYGLVVATQRLSQLDNTVLGMCNNRAYGLATLGNDRERAGKELGFKASERNQLRLLTPGEFFVFGPAISQEVLKVRSDDVQSYHPEAGEVVPPAPPASHELRELVESLSSTEDPAPEEGELPARRSVDVEKQIEKAVAEATAPIERKVADLTRRMTAIASSVGSAIGYLQAAEKQFHVNGHAAAEDHSQPPERANKPPNRAEKAEKRADVAVDQVEVSGPEQKILDALAAYETFGQSVVNKKAVAAFAGYKMGGYTRSIIGGLSTSGLVDYPSTGMLALTPEGRAVANAPEVTTLGDVHDRWLGLCTAPQEKILRVLIEHYPTPISKQQLGEETGYESDGGYFRSIVGGLSTMGALEYPETGMIKATELLFPTDINGRDYTDST